MHSTEKSLSTHRGRAFILPLFFLLAACTADKVPALPPPERIPEYVRDSIRHRLYPVIAGEHAARDSILSYQWELWVEAGDTLYFGLSRPTRSLYPGRREAVVGRCIPNDTGFQYYEELFWTYRFPQDTLRAVVEGIFLAWREGMRMDTFQEWYIAFPDPYSFYDVRMRRWRRIVGKDTISHLREIVERR